MKQHPTDKNLRRSSIRNGLLLVVAAALILEAMSLIQNYFSQKGIKEEASLRAESQMEATRLKILDIINQTEAVVRNQVWITQWALEFPDSLQAVTRRVVAENPVIIGSTVALVPGYDKARPLFAPYSCQVTDDARVQLKSLATEAYDYPSQEWFTKPLELGTGYWSEPYVDTGGGEMLMTTYSLPIQDAQGRTAAVLTADISLDWLTDVVNDVEVYPSAFSVLLSRSGRFMICPIDAYVMEKSIFDVGEMMQDAGAVQSMAQKVLSGHSGNGAVQLRGRDFYAYYAPVERTGWSIAVVIPKDEVFGDLRKISRWITLFEVLGLLLLLLIIRFSRKSENKYRKLADSKERIENELQIARDIQMSMIPKIFPPFPERNDLDLYAAIVPAKEVGGDLYDFFIREEKLYFCIGDVSGKGVPASLVMAVTRSLFRTVSAHEKSPQRIVTAMNESMSDMNESNMFVTFFCGILDLGSGHLRYCNAGHNAPVLLAGGTSFLPTEANIALGVAPGMAFTEQETDLHCGDTLFLYTDGLTEAENEKHELFGEERMLLSLDVTKDAQGLHDAVQDAVDRFVGEASQSDDITMLSFRYLNPDSTGATERHLLLHNDVKQIPQLADFIETIADETNLDPGLAMSLNLALEEAVTNVILYAYPEGSDGLVDVEAIIREHSLEFIITDSGKAFDPTAAPEADVTLSAEDRPIGGLGIFLVRNIMDDVHYERTDGKNILSMTKNI